MENDTQKTIQFKRLGTDNEYYNKVFKKTENIVSVLSYILSETGTTDSNRQQIERIQTRAYETHELALKTLTLYTHEVKQGVLPLQHSLVALLSTLRVAAAAAVIPADVLVLLEEQIDLVLRVLANHYTVEGAQSVDIATSAASKSTTTKPRTQSPRQQRRVQIPAGDISTDAYLVYSQLTDRSERIKTVLEAKPQATIKDIAEVITDVSEKTIQRELNSLIEKGQVVREGERRWSRYSVNK